MSDRGYFIAFEGGDGTGKTTQCRLLCEGLSARGIETVSTREPGGTALGDRVRELLLHPGCDVAAMAEVLLFAAGRAQHVAEVISPALAEGKIVVCDRFLGSTIVYQGLGLGVSLADICAANALATDGLEPDVTIVLDVAVGVARARKREEGQASAGSEDVIEARKRAFHERVRDGYLDLGKHMRNPVTVIDGSQEVGRVHRDVTAILNDLLAGSESCA